MFLNYKNDNWNDLPFVCYKWINSIQKIIKSNKIPILNGNTIYITSDYSGQHKKSKYEIMSFLYTDIDNSISWIYNQRYMRQHILTDGRRISFKGMNDRTKMAALIPFLKASFQIRGVMLTIAVSKQINQLCSGPIFLQNTIKELELKGKWDIKSFDKMLFISNIVTTLIGGLSKSNQHIEWITDNDNFTSNNHKINDLKKILEKLTSAYVQVPLNELWLGTTDIDNGDRIEEDLAAIPDLAAGAFCEIINDLADKFGKISPYILMEYKKKASPKSEIIIDWYFSKSQELLKELIVFDKVEDGYHISKFHLKDT